MWKILKDHDQTQVLLRNKEKLVKIIQWEWKDMNQKMIDVLVVGMSTHIKAIIKAQGGSTRW